MLLESLRSKSVCPITKREITAEERIQFATNICLNACIEAYIDNGGVTYCQVMALLLTCPLTQQLLEDPVTYICGLTFERRMIEGIFAGAGPDTVIINDEKYNIKLNPADASSCDFITISNDQKAYKINSSELKRGTTIAIKDVIAMYHAEKAEHDKRSNIAKDTADEIESPDKKKMSGVTTAGVFKVESTSAIHKQMRPYLLRNHRHLWIGSLSENFLNCAAHWYHQFGYRL